MDFLIAFVSFFLAVIGLVVFLLFSLFEPGPCPEKPNVQAVTDFIVPPPNFLVASSNSERRVPDPETTDAFCDVLLRRQGIDPLKYTVEKEVAKLGVWAGGLCALGAKQVGSGSWTMYYFLLLPRCLLLVFSESSQLVGMIHLERCAVEPFDVPLGSLGSSSPSLFSSSTSASSNPLSGGSISSTSFVAGDDGGVGSSGSFVRLFSRDRTPVCSWRSCCSLYMMLPSSPQQRTWVASLAQAIHECERAMDRAFSRSPPPDWLLSLEASSSAPPTSEQQQQQQQSSSKSLPTLAPSQSLDWLNLFLERYFADMMQSQTYYFRTMKMLSDRLQLVRKPTWIGSLSLKELNIGNAAINLNFVSFQPGGQPKQWIGVADLVYKGGLRISYGAVLNIGKSLRVPVELLVHLESLSGRLFIHMPPTLHSRWAAYFRQMPAVNVTVKVIVGGLDKKVEVTSLNRLHKFAQKTFLKQVELSLVFPSVLRFYLPVLGRKSNLRSLRFNAELGGYQYVIPPEVQKTQDNNKNEKHNAVDERKELVPIWELKGTLKGDLREFVIRRLFDVVLNLGYLKLLSQLLAPSIRMTGGCPQIEFIGEDQVYDHYKQMWASFEDFDVSLLSVTFDEQGNACCRWKKQGIHTKPLWEQTPSGKRVVIYGITHVSFEQEGFRIARLKHFYRLPLFQRL